jgi:S1-C subfamily serine protease
MDGLSEPYTKLSSAILILIFLTGLIAGGLATYYIAYREIDKLNREVSNLQNRLSILVGFSNVTYQNIMVYYNDTLLSQIYEKVKDSVVLVQARTASGRVQGSGFVYNSSGLMVVITNYHVVHGALVGLPGFEPGSFPHKAQGNMLREPKSPSLDQASRQPLLL